MRILFALAGLHRVSRGAEIALTSVATELARAGEDVTLIGSGEEVAGTPYRYLRAPLIPRERFERFPKIPGLRNETAWEEASFVPGFLRVYKPEDYDVTLTCSYPFLNWTLRARHHSGYRPAHVFITQNGDWPARANRSEYRFFGCDGLVCINPDYYDHNRASYRSVLIPNGADLNRFKPGHGARKSFGLPTDVPIVLMVSALIESKMVSMAIEAVGRLEGVHLAVAGDGPLRDILRAQAESKMPGRYHNFTTSAERMPDLYRSANAFLHLSRDESFGNVFVEAMACGLPLVAWDLSRTRWIAGEHSLLVAETDPSALTDRISEALRAKVPVSAMVRRAQEFPWPKIAAQYRTFLETLVLDYSCRI